MKEKGGLINLVLIKIHKGLCKMYPIKVNILPAIVIVSIPLILLYRLLVIAGIYDKIIGAFIMTILMLIVISVYLYNDKLDYE